MADAFVQLDRVGNGYAMRSGGRADSLMFIHQYVIGTSTDFDTTVPFANYTAMIGGFSGNAVDVGALYMVKDTSTGTWHVRAASTAPLGAAAFVNVLFISLAICADDGSVTQE